MEPVRKLDLNPIAKTANTAVLTQEEDNMNTLPQTTTPQTLDNTVVSYPAKTRHKLNCEENRFQQDFHDPAFPITSVQYAKTKRMMDIVGSLFALLLLSPIMLTVALIIRLTSKGPVFFKQVRVGRGGRFFHCYKFRSMYQDAEARKEELAHLNEMSGPVFKIKNDPRITPIGRIIRKFSIDEFPQFFNVLLGDMSLVGPRPPIPAEVEEYTPYQRQRLAVLPGITCIWQISGRNNINFERWVELDLLYIENMSFWTDFKILLQTLPAVLRTDGAQ
jgi:exopolysaccharide biosynthesis polyprenyl glycosylphosphotransferase